jgi:trigger factor
MNITKAQVDALNAIVTVAITKEDYSDKVEKVLADYRKNAAISGFRKGAVPMSLIQKQYGKAVLLEEVNKILQTSLNNYLTSEKLDILGNPLPVVTESIDWDAEQFSFDFELGLAPEFSKALTISFLSNQSHLEKGQDHSLTQMINKLFLFYQRILSFLQAFCCSPCRYK